MQAAMFLMTGMCVLLGVHGVATVVDVVTGSADHTNLATAVVNNELVTTLSGTGPFTVFGPSDTVMPPNLAKSDDNTALLTYHVLSGRFLAADLAACQVVATVNGKKLKITKNWAGSVMLADGTATATVTTADLTADNGVVHSIDTVLTVPTDDSSLTCTVVDVVVGSADHTNLATAVVNNELVTTLSETGSCGASSSCQTQFTVFGPSNSVMPADLPKSDANAALLTYHVLSGRFLAADLAACQVVATVNGKKLKITKGAAGSVVLSDGTAFATVTAPDLTADNGVVHSIDTLLTVPTDDSSLMCEATGDATTSANADTSAAYQSTRRATALSMLVIGWLS